MSDTSATRIVIAALRGGADEADLVWFRAQHIAPPVPKILHSAGNVYRVLDGGAELTFRPTHRPDIFTLIYRVLDRPATAVDLRHLISGERLDERLRVMVDRQVAQLGKVAPSLARYIRPRLIVDNQLMTFRGESVVKRDLESAGPSNTHRAGNLSGALRRADYGDEDDAD